MPTVICVVMQATLLTSVMLHTWQSSLQSTSITWNPSLSPPKLEDKKKGKEKAKRESKTPLNDEDEEDGSSDTVTTAAVLKTSKGAGSTCGKKG